MSILALDIATTTGWALGRSGEPPISGHRTVPDSGINTGNYFDTWRRWLLDLLAEYDPTILAYESPLLFAKGGGWAKFKMWGLIAMCQQVSVEQKLKEHPVDLDKHRKSFLVVRPKSRKSLDMKKATVETCAARGLIVRDHNEADALSVLFYSARVNSVLVSWPTTPKLGLF